MSELPNISILASDGCVTNYVGFSQSSVNACKFVQLKFPFFSLVGGGGAVV